MSFAVDGERSLRNNKRKHKSKLERYEDLTGSHIKSKIAHKNLSPEELQKIAQKTKQEELATLKKRIIVFSFIFAVIVAILIFLVFFFKTDYCIICYSDRP